MTMSMTPQRSRMHPRRRAYIVLNICGAVVLLVSVLFMPLLKHSHRESPDGHFMIVVRTQPIYALIPHMPGGGSDLPGRATLYKDGKSCGSVALPMASLIYELQWHLDARPREAEIRSAGRWNLDECAVEAE
jgi:hypothetical protein